MKVIFAIAQVAVLATAADAISIHDKAGLNKEFFVDFVKTAVYDPRPGQKDGGRMKYGRVGPVERQNGPRCFESATDSTIAMQAYFANVHRSPLGPLMFSKSPSYICGDKFLNRQSTIGNGNRCMADSYIKWGAWFKTPQSHRSNWPELLGFCGRHYTNKADVTRAMLTKCGAHNEVVKAPIDLCKIRNYDILRHNEGKCGSYTKSWPRLSWRMHARMPRHFTSSVCKACMTPNTKSNQVSDAWGGTESECRASVKGLAKRHISTTDYCSCAAMTNNYTKWRIPQTIKKGDLLGECSIDLRKVYAKDIQAFQKKHPTFPQTTKFPSKGSISNMLIAKAIMEFGGVYSHVDATKITSDLSKLGTRCSSSHDHYVVIVGFNFKHSEPYWILKNSHGEKVGDKGYFYLPMGKKCSGGGESGWLSGADSVMFPFWQFKNDARGQMCKNFGGKMRTRFCASKHAYLNSNRIPALFR
eukprot:CAMPEP_0203755098 /NCGR_PEP_ID=MMETSP0098-20131031/8610_1 /ASSEMBLY_ACC=CAM_ASM_000208 /TAXON_ID=96639 /ORGANISM=" , Strain NY0313808BC1" /LENGTH=470 /DNA_ID=CAMNT_0050646423 /DNA_START=49 /DNA_END=1461 /DNA_ORIENTATION=-